jgi:preprotein translocase subunit SecG
MESLGSVLLVLQLIVAIFLVAVILMQRSNGGALSGLGGDSGLGSLLSARGKGNVLTRTTAVLATLFFALSMALSIYYSRVEVRQVSIVDTPAVAVEVEETVPDATVPEVPVEAEIPVVPVAE